MGWFLGCVVVVLGCYLVSLQVAAERKKVADMDRAIARATRDIRQLETEFNTRASLAQLERWNREDMMLDAPRAEQFVADEAVLAALDPATLGTPQPVLAKLDAPAVPPAFAHAAPTPAPRTAAQPAPKPASPVLAVASGTPAPSRTVAMISRKLLADPSFGALLDAPRGTR
ncbi:MAG: hypothetical protein A4S16_06720 [Proteobacteria bacterium SG_bin6]|nr:MAG: hypothetical protein A4S16_06720 [Proteobacteria bacterium SG_bin6]